MDTMNKRLLREAVRNIMLTSSSPPPPTHTPQELFFLKLSCFSPGYSAPDLKSQMLAFLRRGER